MAPPNHSMAALHRTALLICGYMVLSAYFHAPMIAPPMMRLIRTWMVSMSTSLNGSRFQSMPERPIGAMKPSQATKPRNAPSVADTALLVAMKNPSTASMTTVAMKCERYDFQTPEALAAAISASVILVRRIHSLPKRIGEYHRAPMAKLTTAEIRTGQILMVYMVMNLIIARMI